MDAVGAPVFESGLALFLLLTFGALLVLVIAALVRVSGEIGRIPAIIAAGVLLLPGLLLLLIRLDTTFHSTTEVQVSGTEHDTSGRFDYRVTSQPIAVISRNQWLELDEAQFTANVYPGAESAVKALATRVRRKVDEHALLPRSVSTDPKQRAAMTLYGELLEERNRFLGLQVADWFTTQFPDCHVYAAEPGEIPPMPCPSDEIYVRLERKSLGQEVAAWDRTKQLTTIRIEGLIQSQPMSVPVSIDYIDKPWVESLDTFVSERPDRRMVVGYSGDFVSSEATARRVALEDARQKAEFQTDGSWVYPGESFVIDRFAQKLSRPYGDVWREAVLMELSDQRLQSVVTDIRQSQGRQTTAVGGAILLFAGAGLLCLLLNVLTQGYYQKRLMITGAIIVALGILIVPYFVGSMVEFDDMPTPARVERSDQGYPSPP